MMMFGKIFDRFKRKVRHVTCLENCPLCRGSGRKVGIAPISLVGGDKLEIHLDNIPIAIIRPESAASLQVDETCSTWRILRQKGLR